MELSRVESTIKAIRSQQDVTVQDILDLIHDLCDDIKSDTEQPLEEHFFGDNDAAVGRLCWLAMLVERVKRNHDSVFSLPKYEQRWERANRKFSGAKDDIQKISAALQQADQKESEADQMEDVLKEKKAELDEREKQLALRMVKLEDEKRKLDKRIAGFPKKEALEKQLENEVFHKEQLLKQLQEMAQELGNLNRECQELQTQLRETEKACSEMRGKIAGLKRDIQEKERELEELQGIYDNDAAKVTEFQQQIDGYKKLLEQLPSLTDLKEELKHIKQEYEAAKIKNGNEIAKIKAECKALREKIAELDRQLADKVQERDGLNEEEGNKKNEIESYSNDIKTAKAGIEKLKDEIGKIQVQLRDLFQNMKEQDEEKQRLTKLNEEMKDGIAKTQSELMEMAKEQAESLEPLRRQVNLIGHLLGNLTADQILGDGWMIDKQHYLELRKKMHEQISTVQMAVSKCQGKYKEILAELEQGRL